MKTRVLVAMSGGVDSSVAAYLLLREGYEVVGVTFQLYDYSRINRKNGAGGCCSLEDVDDARYVCEKLGIRHYLFDSRDRFRSKVLNYFADSYKNGKTPNPCVACNTFIKFDELSHYADAIDAPLYATGHYGKIQHFDGRATLEVAADESRDQSYFLMGVGQTKLNRLLLPLGEYHKDEVRKIAREQGLPVSEKPDSMEICFVPDNNYRKFLKEEFNFEDRPGEIVDESGRVVGSHSGVHHFTVGQRKGLPALGFDGYYVLSVDSESRQVRIGRDESLFSPGFLFSAEDPERFVRTAGEDLTVKIRSRAPFVKARILHLGGESFECRFSEPQRAVTPGQFAVFYIGKRVVGGGPIQKPMANFVHVDRESSREAQSSI